MVQIEGCGHQIRDPAHWVPLLMQETCSKLLKNCGLKKAKRRLERNRENCNRKTRESQEKRVKKGRVFKSAQRDTATRHTLACCDWLGGCPCSQFIACLSEFNIEMCSNGNNSDSTLIRRLAIHHDVAGTVRDLAPEIRQERNGTKTGLKNQHVPHATWRRTPLERFSNASRKPPETLFSSPSTRLLARSRHPHSFRVSHHRSPMQSLGRGSITFTS